MASLTGGEIFKPGYICNKYGHALVKCPRRRAKEWNQTQSSVQLDRKFHRSFRARITMTPVKNRRMV